MCNQANIRVVITAFYFDFTSPRAKVHARRVLTLDDYSHSHVAQAGDVATVIHTVLSAPLHPVINMQC